MAWKYGRHICSICKREQYVILRVSPRVKALRLSSSVQRSEYKMMLGVVCWQCDFPPGGSMGPLGRPADPGGQPASENKAVDQAVSKILDQRKGLFSRRRRKRSDDDESDDNNEEGADA
ncbi:MAG: hypothetical protein D6746_07505 [Bacteroidetes bacterium]|nr:MAG: hypothetical protein D6746_07505 [Bacteroidota bacterium]